MEEHICIGSVGLCCHGFVERIRLDSLKEGSIYGGTAVEVFGQESERNQAEQQQEQRN
jgi:hypothetical protein